MDAPQVTARLDPNLHASPPTLDGVPHTAPMRFIRGLAVIRFARWFGGEFARGFRRSWAEQRRPEDAAERRALAGRLAADMRQVADRG